MIVLLVLSLRSHHQTQGHLEFQFIIKLQKNDTPLKIKSLQHEIVLIFFKKDFPCLFLQVEGGKKERERNISVWLPLMHPLLGTWPATPRHVP